MAHGETYEYGYVHGLLVDGLSRDENGMSGAAEWIALVETAPAISVDTEKKSLLTIFNELGQDGWVIGDAVQAQVENNEITGSWQAALVATRGALGIIRTRQSRWMHRRIAWEDDAVPPPSDQ